MEKVFAWATVNTPVWYQNKHGPQKAVDAQKRGRKTEDRPLLPEPRFILFDNESCFSRLRRPNLLVLGRELLVVRILIAVVIHHWYILVQCKQPYGSTDHVVGRGRGTEAGGRAVKRIERIADAFV